MRIYINDKCMEQLFELPKNTQKKVLEFQKKFRENSKSEAIHLEPISTFKDPQLRTARIDNKYRAIIKVPQTGDDYYLLWVDNHDEAMDWAKNKIFHWNENTQTAQIFTASVSEYNENISPVLPDNNLFHFLSNEQLLAMGVPAQLLSLVRNLKDLNALGEAEKYIPTDAYENLFYLSDGINYDTLLAEINEGKIASNNLIDQIESNNNKRSFVEVNDDLMNEIMNGELSKWQIFLHPSQRKLVESNFKGSVKITGGAGTGKTVVALHRLKYLSLLPDSHDERKIVFVTFTNALTSNLIKLSEKLSIDSTKIKINNIDSLARELGNDHQIIEKGVRILDTYNSKSSNELWEDLLEENLSEFDTLFLLAEYQNVILFNNIHQLEAYLNVSRIGRGKPITRKQRMDIWGLIEKYQVKKRKDGYLDRAELYNKLSDYFQTHEKPFKYLIADEIQDFSNVELRFLRALVEEKANDLFLVGDPYQKIYAKKLNFTLAGIAVRGNRSKQLRINYRTSEEIKRLALSAIQGLNYDDFDGESETLSGYLSLFHGDKPTYTILKTKEDELQDILNTVKLCVEKGYQYHEIAIGCRVKDSVKEVKTYLHKNKIPYQDNSVQHTKSADGIMLSTFHNLKGLEFKVVILSEINNRTAPLHFQKLDQLSATEKQEYLQSEKSLLYVAITRAINILKIVGTGVKSDLIGV